MDTVSQLEKAIETLVERYKAQAERISELEEDIEKLKDSSDDTWEKEKKEIREKIEGMIEIIRDLGIKPVD
ncbi:MAG TPA: hypothetical protein PK014_11165 [Thermoanaerobaculia bacterium]|nr:hypothetical protein [Thermoanaerobaculia bacterium]HUM30684.1 hypothetical protein [Thermoanaerobaculia bacterium]HXK68908.1 hypothetical protein [Thermoanaerobaculia bacterium]